MAGSVKRLSLLQKTSSLYHTSCMVSRSHYDTLGLTPKATQADVKSAFYRLSKMYHPDTNSGDHAAAEKFKEVLDAYEVLSNVTARSEYDRGTKVADRVVNSTSSRGFTVPDDPQAAFFKSRLMRRMDAKEKYNFDTWTEMHYRNSFQQRLSNKPSSSSSHEPLKRPNFKRRNAFAYISFIIACMSLFGVSYLGNVLDSKR